MPAGSADAPSSPPPAPNVVIALARPPLLQDSLSLTAVVTVAVLASTLADIVPHLLAGDAPSGESLLWAGFVAVWLAAYGLFVARRCIARRRPMPPIVFAAEAVGLPSHADAHSPVWLRYDALIAIGEGARVRFAMGRRRPAAKLLRRYFLETEKRVVSLDEQWFVDASGAERFFAALRERLGGTGGVSDQLLLTERLRRPTLVALTRYPFACQMTIGVMAVLFLNTWLKGALDAPFGLLRWGAMAPALAGSLGEAYRFISANFLHGHWLHALMNVWSLSYIGGLIERLLGRARFTILFFCSALAAMLASAYNAGALVSVGASGAIFGLLGAFAIASRRLRRALPLGIRQPPRWWLSLIAVNVLLSLRWPVIDWTAHVAGFAMGAGCAWALLGRRRSLPEAPSRQLNALAACMVALTAAALTQAVVRAASANAAQETRLAQMLLRDPRSTAGALTTVAWTWAVDPEADEEHLEAGTRCAQEAIGRAPQSLDAHVTLATLWRRRGDHVAALEQWRVATELSRLDAAASASPSAASAAHGSDDEWSGLFAMQAVREWDALAPAEKPTLGRIEMGDDEWRYLPGTEPTAQGTGDARRLAMYAALRDATGRTVGIARLAGLSGTTALPAAFHRAAKEVGATAANLIAAGPPPDAGSHASAPAPAAAAPAVEWELFHPPPRLLTALAPL